MDKTPFIIIAVIVLLTAVFLVWYNTGSKVQPTPMPDGIVFFYSIKCSHCKNVEEFVEQNNIQERVPFTSLEVYGSKANAMLLINTGVACKLDSQNIGAVPLLWDGQKCYLGDIDIINYFKNAAGI